MSKYKNVGRIKDFLKNHWAIIFITIFMLGCISFLIIYKDNIYVSANDTLDSNIAYMQYTHKAFLKGEDIWNISSPILGGDKNTDRLFQMSCLSVFSFVRLIYLLFDAFVAYCICFFARIFLGMAGWCFLFRCIWGKEKTQKYINIILMYGFIYGILPVWPMSMAVSAFPGLVSFLVLAYKKDSARYSFYTLLFPIVFGGGLALYGCFILGFILLFIIADVLRKKRINKGIISCFILLLIWYIISEYSLIVSVGSGSTIRTDGAMIIPQFDIVELLQSIEKKLVKGAYHCGTNQHIFVVPICSLYFIVSNIYALYKERKIVALKRVYNLFFCWYLFNGIIAGIAINEYGSFFIKRIFPFLSGINLERFVWFNPLLLWLCLTILSVELYSNKKYVLSYGVIIATLFSVIMGRPLLSVVMYNNLGDNIHWYVLDGKFHKTDERYMTWKGRMSEHLFERIKEDIDYKDEWSIAFGFLPSVLTYNEIYTLDGYDSAYSKEYKEKFARLISPYLENGEKWVDYYYESGIRAYVFSDELNFEEYSDDFPNTEMLIDIDAFKEMGGKYIFSVVNVVNSNELGLELLNVYEDETSGYSKMHVYQVK